MGRPAGLRLFPLAPLLERSGFSQGALADRAGVDRRTVCRKVHEGLTEAQADVWAVRCGLHPSAVWGQLWWATAPDAEEVHLALVG